MTYYLLANPNSGAGKGARTLETLIPYLEKNNYEKISDLKIGDEVLTIDSSFQKITDISKVPYKGIMKEIKIFGNSRKILCTPNHPFLIKDFDRTTIPNRL